MQAKKQNNLKKFARGWFCLGYRFPIVNQNDYDRLILAKGSAIFAAKGLKHSHNVWVKLPVDAGLVAVT